MTTRGFIPVACALGAALLSPAAFAASEYLIIDENGPVTQTTIYATGETYPVQLGTKWRPWCGSDLTQFSPADFAALVAQLRDAQANPKPSKGLNAIIDNSPGGGGGTGLNLVFNVSNAPSQAALDSLAEAELIIESYFNDPISATISVTWAPIGALGATGSSFVPNVSYSTVRNGLQADMDADDYIESFLPAGGTVPVRYNGGSATVTNEGLIDVNTATFRAGIGAVGGNAASMTISTNFNWDYDPSNGVPGFQFCFQSTFIHEVGHALGFTSGADGANFMEILDLYRFQRTDGAGDFNPDSEAEFQVRPRLVDNNSPNDDHNTNLFLPDSTDLEHRMSDGNPDQASHWRDQFPAIGIMDPTGAPGETFFPDFFQLSDLRLLDAIGWDWAPENGLTTIPFFDGFNVIAIDTSLWTGNDGAFVNASSIGPPSGPNALNLNFNDELRSALMDTSGVDTVRVSYWWQSGGSLPVPESNEDLVVEYRNGSGAWIELARYDGGQGSTPFAFASHDLTVADDALHSGFRIRLRTEAGGTADNWFVDDVGIIGFSPPSNDGCLIPIQMFEGANAFDSTNATTEGMSEPCGNYESDIWFFHVAQCDGEVTISVCDATYDTQLAIYGPSCPNMPSLAIVCNDDDCGTGSSVTYPVVNGQFNRIRLGSASGLTGTGTVMISCGPIGAAPCPWDCTPMGGGNGVVNIDDLLEVINNFGAGATCDSSPDNGDGTFGNGVINIDDLLSTINNFGACPN
jgi:hypothetical protein